MHCFESALMRDRLFNLARELDPDCPRDDLLLDEILQDHQVAGIQALLEPGAEPVKALVRELVHQLPAAA